MNVRNQRLGTILFTTLAGCASFSILEVLLPLYAKSALGFDASGFSSLVSIQKIFLVPGITMLPWLLRRMSSTLLCGTALVVYGVCMPAMFLTHHATAFMPVYVLHSVACEYVFVALNALTQAVDPQSPATPNTLYRLARAAASVMSPWVTARVLANLGAEQVFRSLPLLMAGAMLGAGALIRVYPLPENDVNVTTDDNAAVSTKADASDCASVHKRAGGVRKKLICFVMSASSALGGLGGVKLVCLMQILGTTWVTVHTFIFFWVTEDLGHDVTYFSALKSATKLGSFLSITLVGVGMKQLGMKQTMLLCQVFSTVCMGLMAVSRTLGVYGYAGMCMATDAIPMISSIWVSRVALALRNDSNSSLGGGGDVTGRKASAYAMKKVVGRAINAAGLCVLGMVARWAGNKQVVFGICSAVSLIGTLCFALTPPPPPLARAGAGGVADPVLFNRHSHLTPEEKKKEN